MINKAVSRGYCKRKLSRQGVIYTFLSMAQSPPEFTLILSKPFSSKMRDNKRAITNSSSRIKPIYSGNIYHYIL